MIYAVCLLKKYLLNDYNMPQKNQNEFRIIIPSRYESSRFPGKPLAQIAGKPMIQHVYERALKSGAKSVVIATDDQRIYDAAEKFKAEVCMTSKEHFSGTDRLAEVVQKLNYQDDDLIVNVQGDEPLIPIANILQVAEDRRDAIYRVSPNRVSQKFSQNHILQNYVSQNCISSLYEPITDPKQIFAPNIAKVVFDHKGYALYFSRAPIPYDRDNFVNNSTSQSSRQTYYKHVGIYAYTVSFLKQFAKWPPCQYEILEKLEQLRVLFYGAKIHLVKAKESGAIGIDTPEDLEKIKNMIL